MILETTFYSCYYVVMIYPVQHMLVNIYDIEDSCLHRRARNLLEYNAIIAKQK